MDKTIVVTTINKPTTATQKFSKVEIINDGVDFDCFQNTEKLSRNEIVKKHTKIDFGDGLVRHGKSESWYEDGQKKEEIDYKYGEMGNWKEWYDNGQMSIDIPKNDDGEVPLKNKSM